MKTILSLAGTSTQCSLSSIGLSLARQHRGGADDDADHHHQQLQQQQTTRSSFTRRDVQEVEFSIPQMSAAVSLSLNNNNAHAHSHMHTHTTTHHHAHAPPRSPFGPYTASNSRRASHGKRSRSDSHTRHSLTSSPMEPRLEKEQPHARNSYTSTSTNSNSTWLRRLSSSLSTSRDSHIRTPSRTPTSRPASAAVSNSNGSCAISHTGSSTPILLAGSTPSQTAPAPSASLQRNKLIKRTSSLHSTGSSPGSRIPVFRRPATSHQRSATLSERLSNSDISGRMPLLGSSPTSRDTQWQPYFTPRAAAASIATSKRRGSTSIPNPIRRVYPDRKYTPTLVSVKGITRSVAVEIDDGASDYEADMESTENQHQIGQSTASSPFPVPTAHFEEATFPRRSFSIGDLLSTGPQQLWRRPSNGKGRPWSSRSTRRAKPKFAANADVLPMGSHVSKTLDTASERPAKRRELADSKASQRSIYSSSSSNYAYTSEPVHDIELHLDDELSYAQAFSDVLKTSEPASARTPDHGQSAGLSSAARYPVPLSATTSEIASTVGSDSDIRSTGGNSTDYQSDNYYDSFPTRTTRSSSGRRGPPIETIFDGSPPTFSSGRSTKLRDFLSDGHEQNGRYSTIEEEGSVVSTPVRSLRNKSVTSTPSARPGAPHIFSSSPPVMHIMPDPDEIDWDGADEGRPHRSLGVQQQDSFPPFNPAPFDQSLPFRFGPSLQPGNTPSAHSTPQKHGQSPMDRANLFHWAELQPSPGHSNDSPPRPRTVHGKKDQDSRGSRPAGRRGPSGMHARSHSVPVVPDLDGKRSNVVANKFGTWGVGSKNVTEDWNEDFDFDEAILPAPNTIDQDERRIDSGHAMFVPQSIREQQHNVVANISLLREWGLLIEELKDLRIRAVHLKMLNGPYAQAWREVDAMIDLADQESQEHTIAPRRTPPSSPGFDVTAFDDKTPVKLDARPRHSSADHARTSLASSANTLQRSVHSQVSPAVTRPRKDSELIAQSVIAALQRRRSPDSAATALSADSSPKVPFDTATLRHIVPYVNGLTRKVKEALRETEGLHSSPQRRRTPDTQHLQGNEVEETAFGSMFNSPQDDDVMNRRQTRREQAATDHDGSESASSDPESEIADSLQKLRLPPQ